MNLESVVDRSRPAGWLLVVEALLLVSCSSEPDAEKLSAGGTGGAGEEAGADVDGVGGMGGGHYAEAGLAGMGAIGGAGGVAGAGAAGSGGGDVSELDASWVRVLGPDARINSVASTDSGNAIVAGAFWGATDFGEGVVVPEGERDGFIVWYSVDGEVERVVTYGGAGNETVLHVGPWQNNGIIVAGWLGSIDAESICGFASAPTTKDYFVAWLDEGGICEHIVKVVSDVVPAVARFASDASGAVAVATEMKAGVVSVFEPADAPLGLTNVEFLNGEFVRGIGRPIPQVDPWRPAIATRGFSVDMGKIWQRDYEIDELTLNQGTRWSSGQDEDMLVAPAVLAKSNQEVIVGYRYAEDAGCGVTIRQDGGSSWAKEFGDVCNNQDEPVVIGAASAGELMIAGSFHQEIRFGNTQLLASDGESNVDAFVLRLSPDGSPLLSKRFGGPGPDEVRGLAVVEGGDLIVGAHGEPPKSASSASQQETNVSHVFGLKGIAK